MRFAILFVFAVIFSGCGSKILEQNAPNSTHINRENSIKKSEYTLNLSKYVGKKSADCSSLVTTINRKNNNIYSLSDLSSHYSKDGRRSQAIYNLYKSKNQINYQNASPGDLIFFNNTTKSTKNKTSHNITHIGVVKKIKDDGTIVFLHNLKGKNILSVMNLNHKNSHQIDGKKVNAYIIANCKNINCLVSNRFSGFGKISQDIAVK
ncbi:NlpC/P60 family protein [Campylobacter devanensis]|uniref:NlpC/P60 family protein n=1 Tax=Campylobacter devanensis TaxID=3161138 RepID=UPI000A340E02|nr:NlpC/P60 family protein [Campylobacter sp. P090]